MNQRKKFTYPIIICFMACLLTVSGAALFTPPKEYNSKEEKELAQAPTLYDAGSWDLFTTAWDAFVSDQFPLRDDIIQANQTAALSQGEDVIIGDLYVLEDDYIFSHTPVIPQEKIDKIAEGLAQLQETTGIPVVYNIVPQKNLTMADQEEKIDIGLDLQNLDKFTTALEKNGILVADSYKYISTFSLEDRSSFYFKTDYHWNELGAYTSATYLSKFLASKHLIAKTSVPVDDDFVWTDYTGIKDYLGDLRKQLSEEVTVQEYIPVYEPYDTTGLLYYREQNGPSVPRDTIVASGMNEQVIGHNQMSTYNPNYLRVENLFAPEEKKVLVLRDSYACTMVDYLTSMFSETTFVDPRFKTVPKLQKLLEDNDFDMILCIYHNSNASQELINYLNAYNKSVQ